MTDWAQLWIAIQAMAVLAAIINTAMDLYERNFAEIPLWWLGVLALFGWDQIWYEGPYYTHVWIAGAALLGSAYLLEWIEFRIGERLNKQAGIK